MGRVFSGGLTDGPALLTIDGGDASDERTSLHFNGGTASRRDRKNIFTRTEFLNGLPDSPSKHTSITAEHNVDFGFRTTSGLRMPAISGDTIRVIYKTPTVYEIGKTYTVSVVVKMNDGLPPTFLSGGASLSANTFALVICNGICTPATTYRVDDLGGGVYRVSATRSVISLVNQNTGIVKYVPHDARGFITTAWQVEEGIAATPYQFSGDEWEDDYFPEITSSTPEILARTVIRNDAEFLRASVGSDDIEAVTYASGSLGRHIAAPILGKTSGAQNSLFTTIDANTDTFIRRHDHLAKGWNLSPLSVWNNQGELTRAGTAITRRHVLIADHYRIHVGSLIKFVTMGDQVVTREIANSQFVGGDVRLLTLDSDLPSSIKPVKLMPSNWGDFIGESQQDIYTVLASDREKHVHPKRIQVFAMSNGSPVIQFRTPRITALQSFDEPIVGGDSGSPIFTEVNGDLVLISMWWTSAYGPSITQYLSTLATLTDDLIQTCDLTGFTNYA